MAHRRIVPPGRPASTRAFRAASLVAALAAACAPAPREPGTAVIASGTDLESGNPAVTIHPLSRQLQRHALFVTLVRLDSALQPVPYFARGWSWTDGRTLRFSLVADLAWHDGVRTTARDVAFTIDAVRDRELGSPRAGDLADVDSVVAVDDTTAVIHFRSPPAGMPIVLAELPVLPRHLLDTVPRARWRAHPFSTAPVGNGPFRFVERTAGRRWRFERNERFPASLGGPPHLRQLVVAVVDEATTKFAGLVSGELDLAGVSPTMAGLVRRDPTLALMNPPVLFSTVLAFNTTRAPFDDARVRRAISLSVDRTRLVQAAVAGFATPAGSAIPPGLPFSPQRPAVHDSALADRLLDEAGWLRGPDGERRKAGAPLAITLLTVGSGDMAVEQLVQADLRSRGIRAEIRVVELATFLATLRSPARDFDVALTGIPGDIAMGHLSALFATAQRGGALDYTGFHTPALDLAFTRARGAPPDSASRAWGVVDGLLADSTPVAWLYHARGVQGRSRKLEGVVMDLRGELTSVTRWTRAD